VIGKRLKIRAKTAEGLEEIDLGLWEGLTQDEMKKRFAKAYKQWKDDPTSIRPPEGEALAVAGERLGEALHRLSRKHHNSCFALVLGPLALAAVRCQLEGRGYDSFWELHANEPVKYLINVDENKAVQTL
jgi:broad specificity phosphatase PhoE